MERALALVPLLLKPVEWHKKTVTRTSFEATRDLARPDNTALLGAAPLP